MMRRLALILAMLSTTLAFPSYGQDGGTESVFSLGAGARAFGLGNAYVSGADDPSALYWNPAALRNVPSAQLTGMYMPLFGDFTGATYSFVGGVYPTLSTGALGLGFMRVASTFDRYDEASHALGEGQYSESQFLVAYAFERESKWWAGKLAIGSTLKIASQTIDPFSSTASGLDLGFRYLPNFLSGIAIGINFQDLVGADHRLDAAADPAYQTLLAGAGYTKVLANGQAFRLMLQMDMPEQADSRMHFGGEWRFNRLVALRAGFDDGDISFGLGFQVSDYGLDYAFLSRDEAGSSHPISFTTSLGSSLQEQRENIASQQEAREQEAIRRTFEARVGSRRESARQLQANGDYQGAINEWNIVLEYVPDDAEAQSALEQARREIVSQQAASTRDAAKRAIIQTRFDQGLRFYEGREYVRARSEWQAILGLDSTNVDAAQYLSDTQAKINEAMSGHIRRAQQYEQENRLTEAIAEWNNVQAYDPNNARARAAVEAIRNRIQSVSQDYAAAQRRLRIVNLYDESLRLYNSGKYTRAVDNLEQVIRLEPSHEEAKKLLALSKRKLTPLTDAEKAEIRQLYLRGMQFFSQDDYAKAIAEWEKILAIDPTNESVQRNIDDARARLKQTDS